MAPHKSECPAATGQNANENTNSAIIDDNKGLSNLRARLALAGFAVHHLSDDGFLVCRWNLSKLCPDLRTLAAFARQVGATA
jgi:hypothetical protein